MKLEDHQRAQRVQCVDEVGFFNVVFALMFDVLEGIPPVEPAIGEVPSDKGLNGASEGVDANGFVINFREFLEQGT